MNQQLIFIKLGGSILDCADGVKQLGAECQLLRAAGKILALVHGGGKAINNALQAQQIQSTFINGLRVTTPEMMDIIEMVLSGQVNKMIVRMFNVVGAPAFGISGADNQLLECSPLDEQLGSVGHIERINTVWMQNLLTMQHIPVISPVGVNSDGQALNINADWAASRLASDLGIKKLIYLTDTEGIYDRDQRLFTQLNCSQLQALIDNQIVTGGMLAKVKSVIHALSHGVEEVHIIGGRNPKNLCTALLTASCIGTLCIK
jgi:acetylglutamate kinase